MNSWNPPQLPDYWYESDKKKHLPCGLRFFDNLQDKVLVSAIILKYPTIHSHN